MSHRAHDLCAQLKTLYMYVLHSTNLYSIAIFGILVSFIPMSICLLYGEEDILYFQQHSRCNLNSAPVLCVISTEYIGTYVCMYSIPLNGSYYQNRVHFMYILLKWFIVPWSLLCLDHNNFHNSFILISMLGISGCVCWDTTYLDLPFSRRWYGTVTKANKKIKNNKIK